MFNNTLLLATSLTDPAPLNMALVDGPTNQRTLRRAVVGSKTYELTIGHAPSNENAGFDTTRSVVRLAVTERDSETGKDFTAYVQLILSIPQDKVSIQDVTKLVARLVSFMFNGNGDLTGLNAVFVDGVIDDNLSASLPRLYAGEP